MKPIEVKDFGKSQILINGVPQMVHVVVKVYVDEGFELDWDFAPGEKESLERKIERGDITPCGIVVEAIAENIPVEHGSDSLWGTLVSGPDDISQTIADYSMVYNACKHLEEIILETAKYTHKFAV